MGIIIEEDMVPVGDVNEKRAGLVNCSRIVVFLGFGGMGAILKRRGLNKGLTRRH